MLSAEGGSLTFLEANDSVWTTPEPTITTTFQTDTGSKSVPIGERGVLPARMVLDPHVGPSLTGANDPGEDPVLDTNGNVIVPGTPEDRDLLYIAGGRDGLWVQLLASGAGAPCPAWRIDDAGQPGSGVQGSERWCSDVGFLELEGTRFLVAVFGKRGLSRLRLYPMDQVHALADPLNPETGGELTPVLQVNLNKHPQIGSAPSNPSHAVIQYSRSVALALAVDQKDGSFADVYVAMGAHGVVRVALGMDPTGSPQGIATWGPWFGDDSPYVSDPSLTPAYMIPKSMYGDVAFAPKNRFIDPADPRYDRVERPPVVDVVVYRDSEAEAPPQLFLAVDNLFWVSLDIADPLAWGHAMPLHHHEGRVEYRPTGPLDTRTQERVVPRYAVRGVDLGNPSTDETKPTLARTLEVVQHQQSQDWYLVVTCSNFGYHHDYRATLSEPLPYRHDFAFGGSWDSIQGQVATLYYKIEGSWSTQATHADNAENWVDQGGHALALPAVQDLAAGTESEDALLAVHNYRVFDPSINDHRNGICLAVLPLTTLSGPQAQPGNAGLPVYIRRASDLRGRVSFSVTSSILEPDLMIPAGNDGFVQPTGFLEFVAGTGGSSDGLEVLVPAGAGSSFVRRGPTGQVVLDSAQFENSTDPDRQFLFCSGAVEDADRDPNIPYSPSTNPGSTNQRWLLMDLRVRDAGGAIDPEVADYTYFFWEPDGFDNVGRGNYTSATGSRFFDLIEGTTDETAGFLFGMTFRSAEGCHVMDRSELVDLHSQQLAQDLDLWQFPLASPSTQTLVTHPEFNALPRVGAINSPATAITAAQVWWDVKNTSHGLRDHEDAWEVFNSAPVLSRVKDPNGPAGNLDAWVLVVPCGQVAYDAEWDLFDSSAGGDPLFTPAAPWPAEAKRALVQFFPVVPDGFGGWEVEVRAMPSYDFVNTSELVDGCSPLPKFTSPGTGNAFRVRRAEIDVAGATRSYAFIADFGGSLHAIDVTDVLDHPESPGVDSLLQATNVPIHSWGAPYTTLDVHPNPVHDIAIHHDPSVGTRLYVAVRRVGIVVLDFDPTSSTPFTAIEEIQVTDQAYGLEVRDLPGGGHDLLFTDYGGGIRVLGE